MAPVLESKSSVSKLDKARERELFRYYRPIDPKIEKISNDHRSPSTTAQEDVCVHTATSPDTTLTALAQLCALRLGVQRAMVSVIGTQTQYFIAESTKTLNLIDTQQSEVEGDGLWVGCAQVGKEGRLCEKTIELRSIPGNFSCFTVVDLTKDTRFNQLPFVTGPPYFKFYAGTPLTTKKGINIGSLFVLDDVVRPPLTADQEAFLGSVAQTIMKHMEINREAQDRKNAMRMSKGLNAFVEGKDRLPAEDYFPGSWIDSHKPETQDADTSRNPLKKGDETTNSMNGLAQSLDSSGNAKSPSDTSPDESDADVPDPNKNVGHRPTFVRAANLLRESLDLQTQGGVVFLDTAIGFNDQDDNLQAKSSLQDGLENGTSSDEPSFDSQVTRRPSVISDSTPFRHSVISDSLNDGKPQRRAKIISFSSDEPLVGSQTQITAPTTFNPLGEDYFQQLLKRYPCGKLWSFDEDGSLSSSEEEPSLRDDGSPFNNRNIRIQRKQLDTKLLQGCFPGVRQLLFVPLWDSESTRWFSGCFAFSTSNLRVFSTESELSFLRAFNNSVMAEVSRLASIAADRQKGDFIGSISHELRSPLHGILASAEFLSEAESDAFQISLVDTISSCGRTLLDTINHILDFSKINTFERNWHNARKPGFRSKRITRGTSSANKEAPPLMNIYAITDLAAVTEEVVEGVYVGQVFQDISASDILDVSSKPKYRVFERSSASKSISSKGGLDTTNHTKEEVEIILDFAHEDFTFSTQPGALRRVIMNLFGNAMKYTVKGTIKVTIGLHQMKDPVTEQSGLRMFEFKVEDTGKGISSDYLKTKLYTPFCQEDTLASGTGLGLSIVRSIVNILNGSIDVRSQVGRGTEITVCIPLMRQSGTESTSSTPSIAGSSNSSSENPISALQADYSDARVALFEYESGSAWTGQNLDLGRVLVHYISGWFGLRIVQLQSTPKPDLIIVRENDLSKLLCSQIVPALIIVICSNLSRQYNQRTPHMDNKCIIELVSKPFGPYKLAKAMHLCLNRGSLKSILVPNISFSEGSSTGSDMQAEFPDLESLTLEPLDGNKPLAVQTNGIVTVGELLNAHTAVDNLSSEDTERAASSVQGQEFPFPSQSNGALGPQDLKGPDRWEQTRPKLTHRATEPPRKPSPLFYNDISKKGEHTPKGDSSEHVTPIDALPPEERRPPRLLLVDDNSINLRLLETYMKKRKYKLVHSAKNGEVAVQAAKSHHEGYDVIFMDISMPIMNGFEATRQIRELEFSRKRPTPALIIALTGLASSRDQSEAFRSGIDLFMTKPVSFKEVGRLLDNWEANGGAREPES